MPVDAALIAEMFQRHASALALYAAQWTSSADDCVQEALVELARQPAAPDNPPAWLYRVVRNRAMNAARASRRRTTHEQAAAEHRAGPRGDGDPADATGLADVLGRLEADVREIVVLRVWGRFAWREIAELAGSSPSSVQRRYVEALEELREHWSQDHVGRIKTAR